MKRFGFIFVFLLTAPLALAQSENYTIPASAGQVTQLTEIVNAVNLETCFRFGKAAGCTDTGAGGTCVAAQANGGASCTPGQARAADARIFPLTQAGREEYVIFKIAAPTFVSQKEIPNRLGKIAYCQWFEAQDQTGKDAECTKVGLLAGCTCPAQ